MHWSRTTTIYQIYPRSFQDSDGDGLGDLRGVIRRLDYLASLGIETLWLSPIFASPDDDNGYDVSDYTAIQPAFGTLRDFDELLAGVHARGMRLVLDLVANHSSDEHAWFQESVAMRSERSAESMRSTGSIRHKDKADWYVWRGGKGPDGRQPPNNWPSFFSGPAWTYHEATGEHYLHLFSRKQPDLNWDNPDVRQAMYAAMRFWLDRGVDGFRMDVVTLISKAPGLPDAPAGLTFDEIATRYYANGPDIHAYLREMHEEVLRHYDSMALAEGFGVSPQTLNDYTAPERKELGLAYHFETLALTFDGDSRYGKLKRLDLDDLRAVLQRWDNALAGGGWIAQTLGNHDFARMTSRFGSRQERYRARSSKMLLTLLACLRGTPNFYQGDELGMVNPPLDSPEQIDDIDARNYYHAHAPGMSPAERERLLANIAAEGRDNARHPMQWDASPHAGFTTGEPWLRVHPDYAALNAEAQEADEDSVLHYFRDLMRFRKTQDALLAGNFTLVGDSAHVLSFERKLDEVTLRCDFNFSDEEQSAAGNGALAFSNAQAPAPDVLAAWQARLLWR